MPEYRNTISKVFSVFFDREQIPVLKNHVPVYRYFAYRYTGRKFTGTVQLRSDLSDTEGDLKGTEKELQSALFYYEKIKPQCVDAGVSYEERVAKREAEIESLKTALKILSDV